MTPTPSQLAQELHTLRTRLNSPHPGSRENMLMLRRRKSKVIDQLRQHNAWPLPKQLPL